MVGSSFQPAVPGRPPSTRRLLGRVRAALAMAALLVVGSMLAPTNANATTFPETWLADGNFHTYCLTSTFTTAPAVAHNAMSVLDSTTDFTIGQDASCLDGTDIWWWQSDLPAGTRGQASCFAFHADGTCSSNDINIDFPELDLGANDAEDREKTAVHEVGHTIGLGHHSPAAHDCAMRSGDITTFADPLNIKWRRYHAHDIEHINAQY